MKPNQWSQSTTKFHSILNLFHEMKWNCWRQQLNLISEFNKWNWIENLGWFGLHLASLTALTIALSVTLAFFACLIAAALEFNLIDFR